MMQLLFQSQNVYTLRNSFSVSNRCKLVNELLVIDVDKVFVVALLLNFQFFAFNFK